MSERTVFLAALEITDPSRRAAYLEESCRGDPALRSAVEALLRSHLAAGSFLQEPIPVEDAGPEPGSSSTVAEEGASIHPDADPIASTQFMPPSREDETNETPLPAPLSFLTPPSKPGHLGRMAHYEVHEVLGRGAFGVVLRAFDEKLHRMVAIKAMLPEMAATSPPRKRFLREARSAAAVRNENIVSIYAVEEQPIPYLVMEYVPGQTLQQRIEQSGPFELREILTLGRQIAEGLAAAHQLGLVHRDIKPSNILLEKGAALRGKISDFGLARTVDDASLTQSGYIAGTPMYMAPEQARGEAIDGRADLFSLGSVLYIMCTGRPPFRASGTLAVLKRVCEESPRPIQQIIPEIPDWLCRVIGKLHSKNADDRFQSAKEVAAILERGLARLQNSHAGIRKTRPASPSTKASASDGRIARQKERRQIAGRFWIVSAVAALGLTAGLWRYWPRKPTTDPPSALVASAVPREHGSQQPVNAQAGESAEQGPSLAAAKDRNQTGVPTSSGQAGDETSPESSGTAARMIPAGSKLKSAPPPRLAAPFNAKQAQEQQRRWAEHLDVPIEFTNGVGMKFMLIPPGEFTMGSSPEELEKLRSYVEDFFKPWIHLEGPQRYVVVNEPFYLGALEVTRSQFGEFVKATGYSSDAESQGGGFVWGGNGKHVRNPKALWNTAQWYTDDSWPAEFLTTKDISAFCEWMKTEFGGDYVIPDEEQWEYAARAGTETRYFFGDDDSQLKRYAQIVPFNQNRESKGGLLNPNPFGLFDVYGNAKERVRGTDTKFVGRGGHWSSPTLCRSSNRAGEEDEPFMGCGYRLAIVGDLKRAARAPAAKMQE